jgi:alkylation response protein AidB-like acyl-CoA dehydrogenase
MDFELMSEQRMFADSARTFALRELSEGRHARAAAAGFPWDVARRMAGAGLFGLAIAESDGGQGGTLMDAVLAIEQVSLVCPRSADVVQAGNFGPIRTLAEYANADQKERYLRPLLAGEQVIAVAMTEAEAGSAVTDLQTTATPDGEGFRVNGGKVFTSNSEDASVFLVYVRFGPGVGGIGSMLIARDAPGLSFGKPSHFMNGETWMPLHFDDCYVGPEDVLLPAGGFKRQIAAFNAERIGNAARSLALGRYCYNAAIEHARTRRQFGRPLCEFQGIQWKFADMKMRLDAGQLLLYRAATNADRGLPSPQETAIAKAYCNEAGFDVANQSIQTMGGTGFSSDSLVEYCFRKIRGWMIAGGSVEMMRNRIAEGVFERSFSQRPPGERSAS